MSLKVAFLILVDSLILLLVCLLSGFNSHGGRVLFLILAPVVIFMFYIEGLYTFETYDPRKVSVSLLRGMSLSTIVGIVLVKFLNTKLLPVLVIGLMVPYLIKLARKLAFEILSKDFMMQNTVIIGASETLKFVQDEATRKPFMGYRVSGVLNSDDSSQLNLPKDTGLIAIERKFFRNPKFNKLVMKHLQDGVEIVDLAHFTERLTGKIPLCSIDETWFVEHCGHRRSSLNSIAKRLLDIFTAIFLMICLIPVSLVIIPILLIVHGRPIFFKQKRTGLNQKPFTLFKLRTMVVNAEKDGAQWSKPGDMRITPLGKWLRKTRLDELPQLWNILKGEMSLVGPRPERPEIIKSQLEDSIPYYNLRHLVKPGVTGWAQVTFRYGFSKEDSLEKLQYDLFYVKNRSFFQDVLIILKTVKTVLTGAGQ